MGDRQVSRDRQAEAAAAGVTTSIEPVEHPIEVVLAYALAIVGAEYVMRWLPVGTHDWNKFLTPPELSDLMGRHGLEASETAGLIYNPLSGRWRLGGDVSVNYLIYAEKG